MRKNKYQPPENISEVIDDLAEATKVEFSYADKIKQAFTLGVCYRHFPFYVVANIKTNIYKWDLDKVIPDAKDMEWDAFDKKYSLVFGFEFISDTGSSWHQCYRDIRTFGWQRVAVYRQGGDLQYLFEMDLPDNPPGYKKLHLLLKIMISTCKQVQVGTQTIEQPIWETQCEDLKEIQEDDEPDWQTAIANGPQPQLPPGDLDELDERRSVTADPEILEQSTGHHDSDPIPF